MRLLLVLAGSVVYISKICPWNKFEEERQCDIAMTPIQDSSPLEFYSMTSHLDVSWKTNQKWGQKMDPISKALRKRSSKWWCQCKWLASSETTLNPESDQRLNNWAFTKGRIILPKPRVVQTKVVQVAGRSEATLKTKNGRR